MYICTVRKSRYFIFSLNFQHDKHVFSWLSEHSVEDMFIMSKIYRKNKIFFNCTLLCGYYVYYSLLRIHKCFQ